MEKDVLEGWKQFFIELIIIINNNLEKNELFTYYY
jgi:hypothetical protein